MNNAWKKIGRWGWIRFSILLWTAACSQGIDSGFESGNFNKDLPIEFTEQNLSSFGGLELFSRYLRRVELSRRVGKACRGKGIRSDYGSVRLVLVLVGMLLVGARRLEHLQYVCDDPMLLRFCGLRRLPSRPTIVNWLKQFTGERLKGLSELNGVLVHEQIERLGLNRLTVDMDGTVVQAGNQVGWAFRGFNPHRKKNKSYYPLFAHLAQTGQILKSRNRPGNVHDSKGADAFLRELIGELRGQFGRSRKLEFRTDAAFFNEKILKRLERSRSEFAIKAPFWPWLGLKEVVAGRKRWHRVSDEIDGFSIKHFIAGSRSIGSEFDIGRRTLDLFSPDDGYFGTQPSPAHRPTPLVLRCWARRPRENLRRIAQPVRSRRRAH